MKRIIDLSVLISEEFPCTWPSHMPFQRKPLNWYGRPSDGERAPFHVTGRGPYFTEWLIIDEHAGTHFDAPAHFVSPEAHGGGPYTGDEVELAKLSGPAAVIDVTPLADAGTPGRSAEITPAHIEAWERAHGRLQPKEVVLFYSGWDRHYVPGPDGNRYTYDVLVTATAPGWPAPGVPAMALLHERGIACVGTDGPTMGSAHDGVPVHQFGLSRGIAYVELLTGLGRLPARGADFMFLPIKVKGSSGGPGRAVALVGD